MHVLPALDSEGSCLHHVVYPEHAVILQWRTVNTCSWPTRVDHVLFSKRRPSLAMQTWSLLGRLAFASLHSPAQEPWNGFHRWPTGPRITVPGGGARAAIVHPSRCISLAHADLTFCKE